MNRVRNIQFIEKIGKIKLVASNKLEWQCSICGERFVCAGTNWGVVKRSFIKRVLHHQWLHEREKSQKKDSIAKQFEFSQSFKEYSADYKEDLLKELHTQDTCNKTNEKISIIGWLKKIYN